MTYLCVHVCRLRQVKSILEDLDDAQYYGSDHEERESKAANGGGAKETVEEELARLVRQEGHGREGWGGEGWQTKKDAVHSIRIVGVFHAISTGATALPPGTILPLPWFFPFSENEGRPHSFSRRI